MKWKRKKDYYFFGQRAAKKLLTQLYHTSSLNAQKSLQTLVENASRSFGPRITIRC